MDQAFLRARNRREPRSSLVTLGILFSASSFSRATCLGIRGFGVERAVRAPRTTRFE